MKRTTSSLTPGVSPAPKKVPSTAPRNHRRRRIIADDAARSTPVNTNDTPCVDVVDDEHGLGEPAPDLDMAEEEDDDIIDLAATPIHRRLYEKKIPATTEARHVYIDAEAIDSDGDGNDDDDEAVDAGQPDNDDSFIAPEDDEVDVDPSEHRALDNMRVQELDRTDDEEDASTTLESEPGSSADTLIALDDPVHIVCASDLHHHCAPMTSKAPWTPVPLPPKDPCGAFRKLSIRIYYYFQNKNKGDERLDIIPFTRTPATSTVEEFKSLNSTLPISLLGVASGQDVVHPFFHSGWRYIAVSFEELCVLQRLDAAFRNFSPLIIADRPAHLYFDLDCNLTGTQDPAAEELARRLRSAKAEDIVTEFQEAFCTFFLQTYERPPDVSGMWWLTACTDKKISLHGHCSTEAFLNSHGHMKAFIAAFQSFLQDSWAEARADTLLCASAEGCTTKHLLDHVPYSRNSNLRMYGSMKPGKNNTLVPLVRTHSLDPIEALWRSMPTFCLQVASDYKFLTYAHPKPANVRRASRASSSSNFTGGNCSDEQREIIVRLLESSQGVGNAHITTCSIQSEDDGRVQFFRGERQRGVAICPMRGATHRNTAQYFAVGRSRTTFRDFVCKDQKSIPHQLTAAERSILFGDSPSPPLSPKLVTDTGRPVNLMERPLSLTDIGITKDRLEAVLNGQISKKLACAVSDDMCSITIVDRNTGEPDTTTAIIIEHAGVYRLFKANGNKVCVLGADKKKLNSNHHRLQQERKSNTVFKDVLPPQFPFTPEPINSYQTELMERLGGTGMAEAFVDRAHKCVKIGSGNSFWVWNMHCALWVKKSRDDIAYLLGHLLNYAMNIGSTHNKQGELVLGEVGQTLKNPARKSTLVGEARSALKAKEMHAAVMADMVTFVPFEQLLNSHGHLWPCAKLKVLDLQKMALRDRTAGDYFTFTTKRTLLDIQGDISHPLVSEARLWYKELMKKKKKVEEEKKSAVKAKKGGERPVNRMVDEEDQYEEDTASEERLWFWTGYFLTGLVTMAQMLYAVGPRSTGKTNWVLVLIRMMTDNFANPGLDVAVFFGGGDKFSTGNAATLAMNTTIGKRLSVTEEIKKSLPLKDDDVRRFLGVETQRLRGNYGTFEHVATTTKVVIPTNFCHRNDSPEMLENFEAIAFEHKRERRSADNKAIVEKQKEDRFLDQVFSIAAVYAKKIYDNSGVFRVVDSTALINQYQSDTFNEFHADCLVEDEKSNDIHSLTNNELWEAYIWYCGVKGHRFPLTNHVFGRRLGQQFARDHSRYPGLRWNIEFFADQSIENRQLLETKAELSRLQKDVVERVAALASMREARLKELLKAEREAERKKKFKQGQA
jgi:hypothetical protein